jgi:hypothetical protein
MTTEQPPLELTRIALDDVKWYTENPPSLTVPTAEILRAAQALAAAVERAMALQTSRIGADDFLSQFDGGDFDSYSFYRGVSFALAKVNDALGLTDVAP